MTVAYQQLKAAWDSADRRGELNRAAERLAQTATGDEIDDALGRLMDEVRAAGANDETEEIISDVGDRLHGWCHESNHIKTTRNVPSSSENVMTLNGSRSAETTAERAPGGV